MKKIILVILILSQLLYSEVKKTYYGNSNSNLRTECGYKNGKLDGLCKRYYKNGNLRTEGEYKNNYLSGLYRKYYQDGNLEKETNYNIQNLKNRLETSYYENGNIRSRTKWEDQLWYENIGYYKNGKYRHYYTRESRKRFYKNGKLQEYIPKKDRKRHGVLLRYSDSGKTIATIPYKNGLKDGLEKRYFKFINMTVTDYKSYIETPYINGKRNGIYKSYEYDKLVEEVLYKDDIAISGFEYKNNKKYKLNNAKIHNINNWIKNH